LKAGGRALADLLGIQPRTAIAAADVSLVVSIPRNEAVEDLAAALNAHGRNLFRNERVTL